MYLNVDIFENLGFCKNKTKAVSRKSKGIKRRKKYDYTPF